MPAGEFLKRAVQRSAAASGNILRTSVLSEITSIKLLRITPHLIIIRARKSIQEIAGLSPDYFTLIVKSVKTISTWHR